MEAHVKLAPQRRMPRLAHGTRIARRHSLPAFQILKMEIRSRVESFLEGYLLVAPSGGQLGARRRREMGDATHLPSGGTDKGLRETAEGARKVVVGCFEHGVFREPIDLRTNDEVDEELEVGLLGGSARAGGNTKGEAHLEKVHHALRLRGHLLPMLIHNPLLLGIPILIHNEPFIIQIKILPLPSVARLAILLILVLVFARGFRVRRPPQVRVSMSRGGRAGGVGGGGDGSDVIVVVRGKDDGPSTRVSRLSFSALLLCSVGWEGGQQGRPPEPTRTQSRHSPALAALSAANLPPLSACARNLVS